MSLDTEAKEVWQELKDLENRFIHIKTILQNPSVQLSAQEINMWAATTHQLINIDLPTVFRRMHPLLVEMANQ